MGQLLVVCLNLDSFQLPQNSGGYRTDVKVLYDESENLLKTLDPLLRKIQTKFCTNLLKPIHSP